MKNTYLVIPIFLMLTLTSCDPYSDYEQKIENQTNYNVAIVRLHHDSLDNLVPMDTITINKFSEETVYQDGEIGKINQYRTCPGIYFSTGYYESIINYDTALMLDPILELSSRWNFEVIEETKGKGGRCQCKLKITDKDIN